MLSPLAFSLSFLFYTLAFSSPISSPASGPEKRATNCHGISGPFLGDFPDPSLAKFGTTWYSFATGGSIQMAKSNDFQTWTKTSDAVLANIAEANWTAPNNGNYELWAPDVMQRTDGKYVMYFAANDKTTIGPDVQHCVSAALSESTDIDGPYHPQNDFLVCNATTGGAIDPSFFRDDDGKAYVVYKSDVSARTQPGDVRLELREVANSGNNEGLAWVGNTVDLLVQNSQGHDDGFTIEAPYIIKRGDVYFLTYSTHFWGDSTYDVQYAYASSVKGPYTRVATPLLKTGDFAECVNLTGPGGASFQSRDENKMVFHGLTGQVQGTRGLFEATFIVNGDTLSFS